MGVKSKRKHKGKGKSGPVQVVFRAKAPTAGPVRVVPWIEREEEKARQHLRDIMAAG
jgi:hypothetical protein